MFSDQSKMENEQVLYIQNHTGWFCPLTTRSWAKVISSRWSLHLFLPDLLLWEQEAPWVETVQLFSELSAWDPWSLWNRGVGSNMISKAFRKGNESMPGQEKKRKETLSRVLEFEERKTNMRTGIWTHAWTLTPRKLLWCEDVQWEETEEMMKEG